MPRLTDSKILVVEDDPIMCESIQTLLDVHGFDVRTSKSLPEAQNALRDVNFDLVLLDIKLEDQCGLTLFDDLDDERLDTRVIVVTGQHSEQYAITALKKGATDYLKKPFEPNDLIRSVNMVLKRQWRQRELELFKHAVGASSVAIVVADIDGKIVYTNSAYRKLLAADDGVDIRSKNVSAHHDDHVSVDEQIRMALATGNPWEGSVELVNASGRPVVVNKLAAPIPDQIGGVSYGVALMCDATAQVKKTRTITSSRDRYRNVVDSQKEFLYRLSPDLLISFVNQSYAASRGKTPQSMIGIPISGFVQDSVRPMVLNALESVQIGSTPVEIEFNIADENGNTNWQQWRFESIRNAEGRLTELQGVGRDIAVHRGVEERLQDESDRLKKVLARMKRLSGMLSICASCKKIRDDSGYWSRIEDFIENNSDAVFSHSICPECARKLYPELFE